MYKIVKISIVTASNEYDIPEGYEVKSLLQSTPDHIILLCYKYPQPTYSPGYGETAVDANYGRMPPTLTRNY